MAKISNTSLSTLVLPSGVAVPSKGTIEVNEKDWSQASDHDVVKAWLDAGALVLGDLPEGARPVDAPVSGPAADANRFSPADSAGVSGHSVPGATEAESRQPWAPKPAKGDNAAGEKTKADAKK